MDTYYSIVTDAGLEKQVESFVNNTAIKLTHIALGDGDYNPTGAETALESEVFRTAVSRVAQQSSDENTLVIEAIISGTVGPFWIREVGVIDSDGELFAIGRFPATYKPILTDGAVKDITVQMILKFDNASNFELVYNSGMDNGDSSSTFLSQTDYGYVIENVPFATEQRPSFEYDFALGSYTYDYGDLEA